MLRPMKTALLAVSVALLLVGCKTGAEVEPPPYLGNATPTPTPAITTDATPAPTPDVSASPTPTPAAATPTPANVGTVPYGIPVPGKSGFVESPYSSGAGYVDVRGFAPGSEVKDPYSGKIFRVP
jgi:hypothetical protein